jgi:hypothetical protein
MSTVAKFFVVLNLLLAVAFLGAAATFLGYVDSYRTKHTEEVGRHEATKKAAEVEKADLTTRLEQAVRDANVKDADLKRVQAMHDKMATSYAAQKESYDILNSSLQKANAALLVAQQTIADNRNLIAELNKEHNTLVEANRAAKDAEQAAIKAQHGLEQALSNAQEQVQDLQTKLASTSEELRTTTFRLQGMLTRFPGGDVGGEQPPQEGKVLAADNRMNIVVISLGAEDGVKTGFKYTISRGSKYVGELEITDTESKKSAGRIVKATQAMPAQVGDDVSSR